MSSAQRLFDILKTKGLQGVAGARVDAEIPLSESLLNRLANEQAQSMETLQHLRILLPGEDTLVVDAKAKVATKLFGIKVPIHRQVHFLIDREVSLSPSPRMHLRIRDGLSGLEKKFIHWFENLISSMVPGDISLQQDILTIDLGPVLREQGFEPFTGRLEQVRVEGQAGRLMIKVRVSV